MVPNPSQIQQQLSEVSKDDIYPYIGENSQKSHLVFIDGVYSPNFSDITGLKSSTVIAGSFVELSKTDVGRTHSASLKSTLNYVPDTDEASRNSFGSDMLTAVNMVILYCFHLSLI